MRWKDAKTLGVFMWLTNHESLVRAHPLLLRRRSPKLTPRCLCSFSPPTEGPNGGRRAQRVHAGRRPGSDDVLALLLCARQGQARPGPVEASGLAPGAEDHAQVPRQRLLARALADSGAQERLRAHEQTPVRCAPPSICPFESSAPADGASRRSPPLSARPEYAAAFFLLGGSLKDAVNVCVRQLDDFQLAIALARIVEGDDGPVLKSVLQSTVLPRVFEGGHRWLGTWAFWMLKRRDLAVRILIVGPPSAPRPLPAPWLTRQARPPPRRPRSPTCATTSTLRSRPSPTRTTTTRRSRCSSRRSSRSRSRRPRARARCPNGPSSTLSCTTRAFSRGWVRRLSLPRPQPSVLTRVNFACTASRLPCPRPRPRPLLGF